MRIDAHQHYWCITRGDYGWITSAIPELYRDFVPSDLIPSLDRHHIDGSIVIQAAPTVEETEYLLALAREEETILGVVGWLDIGAENWSKHYHQYRQHYKFKGLRIALQEMEHPEDVLEGQSLRTLQMLAEDRLPLDLLLLPHQLHVAIKLIQAVPGLHAVIDHLAKPNIAAGSWEPWRSEISHISQYPNLYCKLSGMVTEAQHQTWTVDEFEPYITHVLQCFGPDRVMFGSDWPVCLRSASYDEVVNVLQHGIPPHWGDEERSKLFGRNAALFYRLETTHSREGGR
ncbi:amidohydrolase family protein [Paenibacillus sp. JSM ZJ436]|uniref:amidohydrolase family protein n=1 Tax=Paenibacillus sp. JSM ZJ436 TaxID=3376190 RepID=UPI0037938957